MHMKSEFKESHDQASYKEQVIRRSFIRRKSMNIPRVQRAFSDSVPVSEPGDEALRIFN